MTSSKRCRNMTFMEQNLQRLRVTS